MSDEGISPQVLMKMGALCVLARLMHYSPMRATL